jgi:serine protease Do
MRKTLVATVVLLGTLPSHGNAQSGEFLRSNPKFIEPFRELVAPYAAHTVRVRCDGKDTCLGVVVDADGWILAKAHDLKGKVTCTFADGRTLDARLAGVHEPTDLAMLHVRARLHSAAVFTSSKDIRAGAWVASVGASAEPAAIGVVSVATRKVNDAYLGVSVESTRDGVVVHGILPQSAAWIAGLYSKDLLLMLNGRYITSADHLEQMFADLKPGDDIVLMVRRGPRDLPLKATLQSREQAGNYRAEFQNRLGGELSTRRSGYSVLLQHDSALKPGDCGGPLVDLKGRVIGINISRAGRVETWAIPGEVVLPLLADLRSGRLTPKIRE